MKYHKWILITVLIHVSSYCNLSGEELIGDITIKGLDEKTLRLVDYHLVCVKGEIYKPGYENYDQGGLMRSLQDLGYLDANVTASSTAVNHVHSIILDVHTGKLFTIKDIRILVSDNSQVQTILNKTKLKIGDPASRNNQTRLLQTSKDVLGKDVHLIRVFDKNEPLVTYEIK